MDKLQQLRDKLAEATVEIQEQNILEILKKNEHYLVDLNTGQLVQGLDADSILVNPVYRSASYAEFKLTLNPLGVVDLKLTGAFHHGFFIDASKFPVLFSSSDEKTAELKAKYGDAIFGLTKINKEDLAIHIKSQVIDYYKSLLVV